MYLLVFVILIISLVGLYGQILALQAARINSSLTGLANTMAIWHGGAISMAAAMIKANKTAGLPCSLTYALPSMLGPTLQRCLVGPVSSPPAPPGTQGTITSKTDQPNLISATENVHLPADYNFARDQFYSIFYQDSTSNQYYVVTFVLPPQLSATNPPPGFIALPPANASPPNTPNQMLSYTLSDLYHQLTISNLPNFSYGVVHNTVTTSTLDSPWYLSQDAGATNVAIHYNLPLIGVNTPLLLAGSVAIVSSPTGF